MFMSLKLILYRVAVGIVPLKNVTKDFLHKIMYLDFNDMDGGGVLKVPSVKISTF